MYDTIRMFLEDYKIDSNLLSNVEIRIQKETGAKMVKGEIENFRVFEHNQRLIIEGSIPKFYYGNNLQNLTRQDVENAINKLSDSLHLPLIEFKVSRLDVGSNLCMKLPLQNYFICLGDLPRFKKSIIANYETIQYSTSKKSLVFYDKVKEMKKKRQIIPNNFDGENILRYEFRFNKRIADSLRLNEVRVKDLFNGEFYTEVIDCWKDYYFKIHRINRAKFNQNDLSALTSKTLRNQLAARGLEEIGVDEMLTIIESNKSDYKHREQCQRAKRLVQELAENTKLTEPHEAIKELDSEIIRVAEENKL